MLPLRSTPMATWPKERQAFPALGALFVLSFAMVALGGITANWPMFGTGLGLALLNALASPLWNVRRHRLYLGTDGIAIAGGARRFVAFGEIERLERDASPYGQTHHLAHVVLRSGERVRIGARHGIIGHEALAVVDDAYDQLEEAVAAYRARVTAEHAEALARGEQPSHAWMSELRARAEPGGFRDGSLAREDLVAVVEDPTADPSARAGAAYALRAVGLNGDERRRVREAAAVTAAPKVRVALQAAADDDADDDHVSVAVSRVEPRRPG